MFTDACCPAPVAGPEREGCLFEAHARAAQASRRQPAVIADAVCGHQIAAVQECLEAPGAVHGVAQHHGMGTLLSIVMIQPSFLRTICAFMQRLGSNGFSRTRGRASWSLSGYRGAITSSLWPRLMRLTLAGGDPCPLRGTSQVAARF